MDVLHHLNRRLARLVRTARQAAPALAVALLLLLPAAPLPATAAPPAKATAAAVDTALRQRIEAAPQGIAMLHRRGSKPLDCAKCHGDKLAIDDNQIVENRECVACHGDYAQVSADLAKKHAADGKAVGHPIDPHLSHLGPEIACTTCHQGHQASRAYCENCHTNFKMTMPGNRPAAR